MKSNRSNCDLFMRFFLVETTTFKNWIKIKISFVQSDKDSNDTLITLKIVVRRAVVDLQYF